MRLGYLFFGMLLTFVAEGRWATCQVLSVPAQDSPIVIKFVAPPYPRIAKDNRILGETTMRLTVNRDGTVKEVKTVIAHRVFEKDVVEALRQWRFKPSKRDYVLEVTCVFDLTFPKKCGAPDYQPITSETNVSAELPTTVYITADLPCVIDN